MDNLAHPDFWLALLQIVSINLVLSGDNAAVIALAARRLQPNLRRRAVIMGSVTAVILRIALVFLAAELLSQPYLQTIGSILLVWVAYRLVQPEKKNGEERPAREYDPMDAIRVIVVADVIMSLDNVLSLAAVARGDWLLLTLGLLTSIPLILVGSDLLIRLINRFPVIVALGGGLLGYVAGDMLISDPAWQKLPWLGEAWAHDTIPVVLAVVIVLAAFRKV
jgi:YjbE family integral membrane protein